MAKKRYINTKFWSDNFIVELNPLDRYIFLYLLTNEHTDICGIYELSWRVMARETGLDDEMLQKMFKRLEGKIYYIDGWIYLKNFAKHQATNEKVKIGIERSLAEVPEKIMAKIKEIEEGMDSLSKPMDSLSKPTNNLNLNSNLNSNLNLNSNIANSDELAENKNEINEILKLFYEINPMLNFGNKTQRKAVEGMIKKFGFEKAYAMVKTGLEVSTQPYAPRVATPVQFVNKLGDIKIFIDQQTNQSTGAKPVVL